MRSESKSEASIYEDLFYNRLSQLKSAKKVSARDMSLSIGQNPGYINGLENRKALPSMTVFFYICEYLNVTPKDFFDEETVCPEQVRVIHEEIRSMDQDTLELLLALIKRLNKNE